MRVCAAIYTRCATSSHRDFDFTWCSKQVQRQFGLGLQSLLYTNPNTRKHARAHAHKFTPARIHAHSGWLNKNLKEDSVVRQAVHRTQQEWTTTYKADGSVAWNATRWRGVYLADIIRYVQPMQCTISMLSPLASMRLPYTNAVRAFDTVIMRMPPLP